MKEILSLFSGLIFGLGLTISNMTNPAKVLSFLDLFGFWDPSLIFVMGGAILVTSPFLFFLKNRNKLILTGKIFLPDKKNFDSSLIYGSLIFGVGWGTVGFCPGPAISSIALLNPHSILFVISMLIGFYVSQILKK